MECIFLVIPFSFTVGKRRPWVCMTSCSRFGRMQLTWQATSSRMHMSSLLPCWMLSISTFTPQISSEPAIVSLMSFSWANWNPLSLASSAGKLPINKTRSTFSESHHSQSLIGSFQAQVNNGWPLLGHIPGLDDGWPRSDVNPGWLPDTIHSDWAPGLNWEDLVYEMWK